MTTGRIRRWFGAMIGIRGGTDLVAEITPSSVMEMNAAETLWEARDALVFEVDWKEGQPNHGRYSYDIPDVTIVIPDGRRILLRHQSQSMGWTSVLVQTQDVWTPIATLTSPDGQMREIGRSRIIANAWRAIVADRMARDLGIIDTMAMTDIEADRLVNVLESSILKQAPVQCTETYLVQHRVTSWSGERPADPDPIPYPTPWSRLDGQWMMRTEPRAYEIEVRAAFRTKGERRPGLVSVALVSHPEIGVAVMPGDAVVKALEDRNRMSIEGAFGGSKPRRMPVITGNARASQIVTLANRALDLDEDLRDAMGTPIAPLVERHVPDLLSAHANALRTAHASEAADIDDQLEQGLEIVRAAVEQGLAARASTDRDALRRELTFLRYRHPEDPMRKDGH